MISLSQRVLARRARAASLALAFAVVAAISVFVARAFAAQAPPSPRRAAVVAHDRTTLEASSRDKYPLEPTEIAEGTFAFPPSRASDAKLNVVYLHGIHGKPENGCPWLRQGASDLGWLVCPRANARATELAGTFTWAGSTPQKTRVIEGALGEIEAGTLSPRGDASRPVVLVGFSQGAFVALELVEARALEIRGVVLMSAEIEPNAASLVRAGVRRVVLASGDLDAPRETMRSAAARLRDQGIEATFVSLGHVGHTYAAEEPRVLADAIRWAGSREDATSDDAAMRRRPRG